MTGDIKLEKLDDKALALRMVKFISTLESVKIRAEYYSIGGCPQKEMNELEDDYYKIREAIRSDAQYLNYNKNIGGKLLRDKYSPSVSEASAWGLYAEINGFSKDCFKGIDDALERLTKYYSYDYWQIIAEL